MRTDSSSYSDYLRAKYLPGRRQYLRRVFYPKILRSFPGADPIVDLGCGTGEFLKFCRAKGRQVLGVDSNEALANACREDGFTIVVDNVCELKALRDKAFKYVICDNVLEHLDRVELNAFFTRLETILLPGGTFICVVPGRRGFKCDPTHKTFVCPNLLEDVLKNRTLRIVDCYYHPFNIPGIDKCLYLNMQVFQLEKCA